MPSVAVDIDLTVTLQVDFRRDIFLCLTVEDIQKYIDHDATIKIGDNFPVVYAMMFENAIAFEVYQYLSEVFSASLYQVLEIPVVREVIAMLTASEIGFAKFGSALGNPLTSWAGRLEDKAWRILQRIYITQGLPLSKRDVPLYKRILFSKRRSRTGVITYT